MYKLSNQIQNTWYYIIVQNPEAGGEQFVGYTDQKTGKAFIPTFKTKEIAQQCFLVMPKDIMNHKYEVQAIIQEDLMSLAQQNGYDIFVMDDKGRVLEKIS
ncbi:MAG: hypothetical protein NDI81_11700 [Desulfobacula sp.]|nr:hypothetical protein [Desulfobacula sp.]MDA8133408.1 hypothetical protein [Desulfobacteraceae bacterium]